MSATAIAEKPADPPALVRLENRQPVRDELDAAKSAVARAVDGVKVARAAKDKALEDHGRRNNPMQIGSGELLALDRAIEKAQHGQALAEARARRAEREWAALEDPERKVAAAATLARLHALGRAEADKWAIFGEKLGELRDVAKEAIDLRRARGEILFDNSVSSLRDFLAKQIMLALRDVAAEDHNLRGILPTPIAPTAAAWRAYFEQATKPAPGVDLG